MKRCRVVVTPRAMDDIRDTYEWFLTENPLHARRWLDGIRRRILALDTLPESHPVAPESDAFDCEVRQLLLGRGTPWRVFFTVERTMVRVLHVRHGSRDHWRP